MTDTDTGPNGDQAKSRLQRERDEARAEAATAYERGKADGIAESRREVLTLKVRALAAGKVVDPELPTKLLDLDALADADEDGITAALDEFVKAKPFLAQPAPRFQGSVDQGARGTPAHAGDAVDAWLRGRK
jgi:hypothetical protein